MFVMHPSTAMLKQESTFPVKMDMEMGMGTEIHITLMQPCCSHVKTGCFYSIK